MRNGWVVLVLSFLLSLVSNTSIAFPPAGGDSTTVPAYHVRLFGYAKFDASFDDAKTFSGDISFYVLPQSQKAHQFNLTMNQTRLGVEVKGPSISGAEPTLIVSGDFYGGGADNAPQLRMFEAYLDLWWSDQQVLVRIGNTWDTDSFLYANRLSFGYLSDVGGTQYRRPQIRGLKYFSTGDSSKVSMAAAVARTMGPKDLDGNGIDDGSQGLPMGQARIAYEQKGIFSNPTPLIIAFSGHWGQQAFDWNKTGDLAKIDVWSLTGELQLPICPAAYLKGEYFYGSNMDQYYGGIGQGVNTKTHQGIGARGGWVEVTVAPPKSTYSGNVGIGVDLPIYSDLNDGDRSKNAIVFGNFFKDLGPGLTVGLELDRYRTDYKNASDAEDNRIQASCKYTFSISH